eukprot:2198276-Pyramimonas_sp.AAC.1
MPALPASDWSVVRICPRFLRPIGSSREYATSFLPACSPGCAAGSSSSDWSFGSTAPERRHLAPGNALRQREQAAAATAQFYTTILL